jgi:nucleotide-binding universal stress UspA family protein
MERPDSPTPTITVGCDLTPRAAVAVSWAAQEARGSGAQLRLVTVWHTGVGPHEVLPPPAERDELTREAVAEAGVDPGDATVVGLEGRAGPVLVETARGSRMLVVGSGGHVGALGALSGSVSRYCLHHAVCPVAVIAPDAVGGPVERVLVSGTLDPDGSCLPWAVEQARDNRADVHLLDTWYLEPVVPSYPELDERIREEAQERHAAMRQRLITLGGDDVRVTASLVPGHARDVLQVRARARDLLVIPYAAMHRIALGHGRCPVAVLPSPETLSRLPRPAAAAPDRR